MDQQEFAPRLFADDAAIRWLAEGFCACTLPKEAWTHEAHLATGLWMIVERPDILPEQDLPDMIRRFNVSVGGINDETQGYHETITQGSLIAIRRYLARTSDDLALVERANGLLQAPEGRRDWLLGYYSRDRLFSTDARLGWVEPDLEPLPPPG